MSEIDERYAEQRYQVLTAERVHRAVDILLERAASDNAYAARLAKQKLGELLDLVEGSVSVNGD